MGQLNTLQLVFDTSPTTPLQLPALARGWEGGGLSLEAEGRFLAFGQHRMHQDEVMAASARVRDGQSGATQNESGHRRPRLLEPDITPWLLKACLILFGQFLSRLATA